MKINFGLNGIKAEMEVDPQQRLLDFIRDELHLTGTKESCGQGECGACTVIVDGKAVNSCLMMVGQLDGCDLFTIEGLEQNGELDIIQQEFIKHNASQCGFCTPGMIMSCKALLMRNPSPTREEVKQAIAGNICRCGTYSAVVDATIAAAAYNNGEKGELNE